MRREMGLLVGLWLVTWVVGDPLEFKLLNDMMVGYEPLERPVVNHSQSVKITLGILLQQIINVDEKNQVPPLTSETSYLVGKRDGK